MEYTFEEKIEVLKRYEAWGAFTPPQQAFLCAMAEGLRATEAFMKAYPDTKSPNLVFATQQMLTRVGIRKALALIGIDLKKPKVSKDEAMELLSSHLRKAQIEPEQLVKLLNVYSKLAGWEATEDDKSEEVDMDKLVETLEKRKKK